MFTIKRHFDKSIVTKRRFRGGVSSRRKLTGFEGGASGRCGDFTAFSKKKYAFLSTFWPKFLLKN